MYPSNSNNGNPTIPYTILDQTTEPSYYINPNPNSNSNSNSKQDPHHQDHPLPSCFNFYFPSPYNFYYEDDVVFHQHLHDLQQQQQQQPLIPEGTAIDVLNIMEDSNKKLGFNKQCCQTDHQNSLTLKHNNIPMKRCSSKKDRHSKIDTAQGLRDRRMRLSLDVARQFFGLQDMLGFDKASKTVEWLLINSKTAIEELNFDHQMDLTTCSTFGAPKTSASSTTSEGEVVSGIDESAFNENQKKIKRSTGYEGKKSSSTCTKEKKTSTSRALRKSALFRPQDRRESREKARARAKERVSKKMTKLEFHNESNLPSEAILMDDHYYDMNHLKSWGPFENVKESGTQSHNLNPHLEVLAFDVHQELLRTEISHQEQQFTDFQFYGKPWKA